MPATWTSILPPIITIVLATWSKQIVPSLLVGLIAGCYLLHFSPLGGVENAVDRIAATLSDPDSLQVLLFLYLFSGLVAMIRNSGGITAFSKRVEPNIETQRGVFFTLLALIPVTFIDCGFRIVAAGSIVRPLAQKHQVQRARLALVLNNTASPLVELIPIATTFVGFNVAIIGQGLNAAGVEKEHAAYSVWVSAIPYEFFSLVVLVLTFVSCFVRRDRPKETEMPATAGRDAAGKGMKMDMPDPEPAISPRVANLVVPLALVICLSVFFFWLFGKNKQDGSSFLSAMAQTEPNRAMLVAVFISLALTAVFYRAQRYGLRQMTRDVISGGNEIMPTLVILAVAWPLAAVSQDLGLTDFIQSQLGTSLPVWCVPALLFALSSAVTYFIGSGWGSASLIMPFAIPLAVSVGAPIAICAAAVITGGTFGDTTSPVAGMTNMASNIAHADHAAYMKLANVQNFTAAGIALALFVIFGAF